VGSALRKYSGDNFIAVTILIRNSVREMEFTAFDWNPGMIEFPVPLETRKIIIFTEEKSRTTLMRKN
jgi:hypothetical protein